MAVSSFLRVLAAFWVASFLAIAAAGSARAADQCPAVKAKADCAKKAGCTWSGKACVAKPAKAAVKPTPKKDAKAAVVKPTPKKDAKAAAVKPTPKKDAKKPDVKKPEPKKLDVKKPEPKKPDVKKPEPAPVEPADGEAPMDEGPTDGEEDF